MSFTITNNVYLRNIYSNNRDLTKKNVRSETAKSKLSSADAAALRKGIAALGKFDYSKSNDDDDTTKGKLFNTMRAFSDAFNNTLESTSTSQNASLSKYAKQLKNLSTKYKDQLSTYGINFDSNGYMSVTGSSVDNIAVSKYNNVVGKDSEFMKEVDKIAKKMSNHIDMAV